MYGGLTYYFCSIDCRAKFDHSPLGYVREDSPTHVERARRLRTQEAPRASRPAQPGVKPASGNVIDPVCRMAVSPDSAAGAKLEHEGKTYYFCTPTCKAAFERNPLLYVAGQRPGGGSLEGEGEGIRD